MKRVPHLLLTSTLTSTLTSAIAVAPLPAGFSTSAVAATRVGVWHLDERSGARFTYDSTRPANNGRILGAVRTGILGRAGHAYRFDGGVVAIPDSAALDPRGLPFAVSLWLRPPANLSTGDYNVLQKGRAKTPGGQYKIELGGVTRSGVGKPRCTLRDSAGRVVVVKSSRTDIADGRWHLVSCRRTASTVSISVDGRVRAAVAVRLGSIANSDPLLIGAKGVGLHYYRGDMDEVSLDVG